MVMLCFFFFNQKTAYEMRISDWSSDVFSSDLRPGPRRRQLRRPAALRTQQLRPVAGTAAVPRAAAEDQRRRGLVELPRQRRQLLQAARRPVPEIGRASCRERGCQYV